MKKETIVQFVFFETHASPDDFLNQWEPYSKLIPHRGPVILQQSNDQKNGLRFLSQHVCYADDFQFIFKKNRRPAHSPEVQIKIRELGGYTVIHTENTSHTHTRGKKVMMFSTDPKADVAMYCLLTPAGHVTVYQAYFESCVYTYILEFFVANEQADELAGKLRQDNRLSETVIFQDCSLLQKQKMKHPAPVKKIVQ
jgi:hypothetical protein